MAPHLGLILAHGMRVVQKHGPHVQAGVAQQGGGGGGGGGGGAGAGAGRCCLVDWEGPTDESLVAGVEAVRRCGSGRGVD